MYFFASATNFSASTSSPSMPGTQPASSNISLTFSRRASYSLVFALLMIASHLMLVGSMQPAAELYEAPHTLGQCDRKVDRFARPFLYVPRPRESRPSVNCFTEHPKSRWHMTGSGPVRRFYRAGGYRRHASAGVAPWKCTRFVIS